MQYSMVTFKKVIDRLSYNQNNGCKFSFPPQNFTEVPVKEEKKTFVT